MQIINRHDFKVHKMQGQDTIYALYFILKGGYLMDWLNRMNNAIDYIETNLTNEISFDKAAQIACCSTLVKKRTE